MKQYGSGVSIGPAFRSVRLVGFQDVGLVRLHAINTFNKSVEDFFVQHQKLEILPVALFATINFWVQNVAFRGV